MTQAHKTAPAGKAGVHQEAEEILRENVRDHSAAEATKEELKIGHAVRKGADITGKVLGWAGGVFAIVSTVNIIRNKRQERRDQMMAAQQGQQQAATAGSGRRQ